MPAVPTGSLISLTTGGAVVITTTRSILTTSIAVPRGGLTEGPIKKQDAPPAGGVYCTFHGKPQPRVVSYLLNKTKLKKARAALDGGAAWEDALGPKVKAIPLSAINRVRRDYGDKTLTIAWRDETKRRSRTINLGPIVKSDGPELSMHDAVLDRIGVNGPGWTEQSLAASRWRLAPGPIAGLIIVAIVTAGFAYTANQNPNPAYRSHGKGRLLEDLAHFLGVEGTLLIGGVAALALLAWLVMRMLKPTLETVYIKPDATHV
jgi:hypothetical protein